MQQRWLAPLSLAVLTLIFFWEVLFPQAGYALASSDLQQIHYPLLAFLVRTVRETGTIPLWNPHQFLGYSVVGNPQNGLFYPPNWLLLAFPGESLYRGVGVLVALHVFWGSYGMYTLARLWGSARVPALLAGVIVGFSGFVGARIYAGHYAMILAIAWMPWILAGGRLALWRRAWYWTLPGGVALALQLAAGHPQVTYLTGLGLLFYFLYQGFTAPDRSMLQHYTRQIMVMGVIGLILSAVAWLPTIDYSPKTVRNLEQSSLQFANEFAIPAHQLISTLLVPNLYGKPPTYTGVPFYEEMTVYWGLLPLLLLIIAPRRRETAFFAALIIFGLVMSLGVAGGLYRYMYQWMPIARSFRVPERNLLLTGMGLAGLLALTLTDLMRLTPEERRLRLRPLLHLVIPITVAACWTIALIVPAADAEKTYIAEQFGATGLFLALIGVALYAWTLDGQQALGMALALTCFVGGLDVWRITAGLSETAPTSISPIWREAAYDVPTGAAAQYGRVIQLAPISGIPNGASWTGHDVPQGYDPVAPADWAHLFSKMEADPNGAVHRAMAVRYLLAPMPLENYDFPSADQFELIGLRPPFAFYENKNALPRAYLAGNIIVEPNEAIARDRVAAGDVADGQSVILAEPACELAGEGGTATIREYRPNWVIIAVEASGASVLVLADQYDDDWHVEIDGKDADLLKANTTLRAVCIPAGSHTVTFRYQPWALYVGGAVSVIGWLGLFLLLILIRYPR